MGSSVSRSGFHSKPSQGQSREHEQQPVEEDPPRAQHGIRSEFSDPAHQDGIGRPDQRRERGEHVAQRVEPQHRAAVEGDQGHARQRHEQSGEKARPEPFPAQKQAGQHGREERGEADDYAHVGGEGTGQRNVFKQKVERHPAQPGGHEQRLLPQFPDAGEAGTDEQQRHIAHEKAEKENFQRREVPQQNLGGNEGGAPDQNGRPAPRDAREPCVKS